MSIIISMERLIDFFNRNRYALIWTLGYFTAIWAILRFMFHFDMFSAHYWNMLWHAQLRGFGGFVFGLLILAALPLYVATTAIIWRTKQPLITVPLPKLIKDLYAPGDADAADAAPTPDDTPAPDDTTAPDASDNNAPAAATKEFPSELRGSFMRARNNLNMMAAATPAGTPTPTAAPTISAQDTVTDAPSGPGILPLPPDFDIAPAPAAPDVPMFSDINFDDDDTPAAQSPAPADTNTTDDYTAPITQYLNHVGRTGVTDGQIVICDTLAIAAHTDPDFWIADDTDWFATGRTRPSPVAALVNMAATRGLRPVLYLGATNILDLDDKIAQWGDMGVRVIKDLGDIDATADNA